MKKSFSVMVAIVLIASMSLLAFAACVTDDECRHSAMQCIGAVDATCVENGNVEFWYCPDCGKYYSDEMGEHAISIDDTVIAATGEHDWDAWVTDSESSCTTGGTRHRVCNVCGERQDETLPVGEHDLNFVKAVEATCTKEGNVAHWHCSECGKNYSDEEATEVLNDVTTPKAAHDTTFVEAQAHTCTNDGNIAYWHCGSCNLNYADEDGEQELESVVDPAAHAWGEWEQTSDPTCTERGVLTRVCEVCFDEEYDYIDELGHDFENAEWAYNDANHWHLCNRCGAASQRELHEYDAEGVCVCGMIEYAPTSEFRFISLGGDTWRLANYTGTRRNVSIPSTYNGGTVVAISDNAFAGNMPMETLVIPETVTSIGAEAFADCSNLKNLTMSSKVTTIGDNAFDGCDAIEKASIPANAASYISKGNLVDLTVTNGAIEEYAFASSPKLATVKVVGETTSIGREAFSGCAVLASVEVDGQEVAIGDNAFVDCAMLTDVAFGDVASIGDFAFKDCAAIGELVIPDSVTSIGGGAFSGCSGLTSMRLPFVGGSEQVTPSESTLFGYIFGTESFANSFETVQLYGVEEGQSVAYYIPRNLSTVSVGGDIGFGAFYGCDRLVDVTIEESEDVDAYAFYNNTALSHIGIPTTVTHIGEMAFAYCTALEEIEFPGTIKIVDKYAMSESAWYAAQPDGAVYIDKALYDYKGAFPEELQIKDGTYSVTSEAFLNAYALKSLIVPSGLAVVQDSAFDGCAVTDIVCKMEQISLFPKEAFERVTIIDGTSIPSSAFSGCENLTSITIPDSVTSIGSRAFAGCSGMTSITIPDSVTSIGDYAFSGVTAEIVWGDAPQITSIDDCAFSGYKGESITIPDSVTSIGSSAFRGCSGLTSVTIPDSVTSIGDKAFSGCSGLTSITIPFVGAKADGTGAKYFGYIFGASSYSYNDDYVPKSLKEVIITGGTSIGRYAFDGCSGLTSVTIPDSVASIGEDAFYGCSGLMSVVISDSVTSIGEDAFRGCGGLTSITIPFVGEKANGTGATHFGYIFGAWDYSNNKDYVPGSLKEVIITGGTRINQNAFFSCSGLTSVTIPNSVTSIGGRAFSGCSGLTSIDVEDGNHVYHSEGNCLIETGSKTLIAGCKSSVIPNDGSVTSIGDYAFSGCSGLTSVTIPDSVTSIDSYAFYGCSGLTSIVVEDGNPVYHSAGNCIIETESKTLIAGCKSSVIPDDGSVTSIGNMAFYYCSGLTSIVIPDSVTSIGARAFYGCSGLTSVTIGDGVTSIGDYAFSGVTAEIVWGDAPQITSIDDYAFSGYKGASITIPDSVTSIGSRAFAGCSGMTSITIPDSVTSIGDYAFSGVTAEIVWGDAPQITSIDDCAFSGYKGESITIPDSVTSIGKGAFYSCYDLTSITIPFVGERADGTGATYFGYIFDDPSIGNNNNIYVPESLKKVIITGGTRIDQNAFSGCSGLTRVVISDSVTRIGSRAFYGCSGLTSVTIGDGVTSIGEQAFEDCSSLMGITIPNSVTSIDGVVFYGCSGLTRINFKGTMAQWQAVDKRYNWDAGTGDFTVICTDGTISKADA